MEIVLGCITLGAFGVLIALVEGDSQPEPNRLIKKSRKRQEQLNQQSRPPTSLKSE